MFPFGSFFAGVGSAEVGQLIMWGGLQTRGGSSAPKTEGLAKMEVAMAGSEAEDFYGLLRGPMSHFSLATSSPPPKKACHAPFATVSHLSPQESTEPEASAPADQALESAPLDVPPASEEEIPTHMQPLCIQLGHQKGIQMLGWGLQRGPISLSCYHLCPHMKGAFGSGVGVPPLWQVFLQPWYIQVSQERSY